MKIIYRTTKFHLGRNAQNRLHLIRSLTTHLVMHERIKTTYAKAYNMQPSVEALIKRLKNAKNDQYRFKGLLNYLEIEPAKKKLVDEILPRLENRNPPYTKVVKLGNRKGDNALEGYIELWGNPIA